MKSSWLICLTMLFWTQAAVTYAGDFDALFRECSEGYLSTIKKVKNQDLHYEVRTCTMDSREEAFRGNLKTISGPFSIEVLSDGLFVRTIYRLPGEPTGTICYLGDKYTLRHSPDTKVALIAPRLHGDAYDLFDLEIQGIGRVSNLLKDCMDGVKSYCYEEDSVYQGHKTHIFVVEERIRLTFNPDYGYQVISIDSSPNPARPTEWVFDLFYEEWSECPGKSWFPRRILCFSEHAVEPSHVMIESRVEKLICDPITDASNFKASLPAGTQFGIMINGVSQQTTLAAPIGIHPQELSSIVLKKQIHNLQSAAYSHPRTLLREWRANPEAAAYLKPFLISGFVTFAVSIGLLIWWLRSSSQKPVPEVQMREVRG